MPDAVDAVDAVHEAMRELCPRAELIILPEAGHMLPIEQPAAVAAALDSWLARVGRDDWRCDAGKRAVAGMPDAVDADIVRDCTRQINHYAQLNDAGAVAELCQMFTEDAVFARPSDPD